MAYLSLRLILLAVSLARVYSHNSKITRHEIETTSDSEECLQYNVYYPHNCRGDECMLAASWEPHDEQVEFRLVGRPKGDSVWIALGFSADGKMAGSDVVTCWYYKQKFSIHSAWNSLIGHSTHIDNDDKVSVQLLNANYSNGLFSCNFNKFKVSLNMSTHDKTLTQNWHILLAWGQLYIGDDEIVMKEHAQRYSTECYCNLTDCSQSCLCINQLRQLLLKLHGSVMIIVFVFLLPTAALVARHYRAVFPDNWFKSHMTLMMIGVLGMVLGLGFILGHTAGSFTIGLHQIVGIIAIGLSVVQVIIGIVRPHAGKSLLRKIFLLFHRMNSLMIITLGTTALFLGVWLLHKSHQLALLWMEGLLCVGMATSLLFSMFLEVKSFLKICQDEGTLVEYHKLEQPSINETESEEEVYVKENEQSIEKYTPYFKEKVIFLLFILQSFTITGLLSAFAFYEVQSEHHNT